MSLLEFMHLFGQKSARSFVQGDRVISQRRSFQHCTTEQANEGWMCKGVGKGGAAGPREGLEAEMVAPPVCRIYAGHLATSADPAPAARVAAMAPQLPHCWEVAKLMRERWVAERSSASADWQCQAANRCVAFSCGDHSSLSTLSA